MKYFALVAAFAAFLIGMQIPVTRSKDYALIQKENGGIIVIEKNLTVVACGFKKRMVRNGYCVTTKTAKSWRIL